MISALICLCVRKRRIRSLIILSGFAASSQMLLIPHSPPHPHHHQINRPYGAVDISANLKGAVPKPATQKILLALAEKGEVTQKTYGTVQSSYPFLTLLTPSSPLYMRICDQEKPHYSLRTRVISMLFPSRSSKISRGRQRRSTNATKHWWLN